MRFPIVQLFIECISVETVGEDCLLKWHLLFTTSIIVCGIFFKKKSFYFISRKGKIGVWKVVNEFTKFFLFIIGFQFVEKKINTHNDISVSLYFVIW